MSKIRLKFSKLNRGKYISHLDLLRTFTRAIHRASLPVKYSQGFNPHQLISFSLPLALGVTSETEFVDIEFEDGTDMVEIVKKLNMCLPPDIRILEAQCPKMKAKDIYYAEYIFEITFATDVKEDMVNGFFSRENIPAVKKTKRGEKEINLKEYIFDYEILSTEGNVLKIRMNISAGDEKNIKPGLVAEKLCEFAGNSGCENAEIHRTTIFCKIGEKIEKFC